ncbi:SCP-domain-containing protein [Basidiobolus meristosporus CBS 931.73]|uniref:SCP-domain-containing protein n=1 Tax=Basidiobolus meristosporus CBS 931.73 TaxID=1314790 RepID=A0A1Y1XRP2_9FUNG|nr:SCP-domain-containing protein [Basidiobolus meristosporus CBS 931.73]|eukprot:ORX88428.1 SCP-domain-containing protein [Basidiobolus meristosporus CBS 931.73]
MKSWASLICFLFLLLQVVLGLTTTVTTNVLSRNFDVQRMLNLVNLQRTRNGRAPLKLDNRLVQAAQKHTNYQAKVGQLTHSEPSRPLSLRISETGFRWTAIAENVAMGQISTDAVVRSWMNSPGHRQNILNPQYTYFGAGYSSKGNYWTQVFARGEYNK